MGEIYGITKQDQVHTTNQCRNQEKQQQEELISEWFPVSTYAPEFGDTILDLPGEPVHEKYFQWYQNVMQQESMIQDLILAHKVIDSGIPNRYGCRIPVRSCWNHDLLDCLLKDYDDYEVTEWLKYGFPISRDPNADPPVPSNCNHKGATEYPDAVDEYLKREIEKGATIGPFTLPPFVKDIGISPISSRPKKDSQERRIILDLSWPHGNSVNDGIDKFSYCGEPVELTYLTVDMLAKRIFELKKSGEVRIWKKDIRRAFRIIPLCPKDYSLTGIRWKDRLFFDKVMPMGLCSAAYVCQRVTNTVVYMHKCMGYWSINYLDDFGSTEHATKAWNSYHTFTRLLKNLGVQEAEEKSVPPTTRMDFLGNTLDTERMTIEVSSTRKTELIQELKEWRDRKSATKKQIQSIIGKLNFVTNCVKAGRIFLSRLIDSIREQDNHRKILLTEEFRKDIDWRLEFLPESEGISMLCYTQLR